MRGVGLQLQTRHPDLYEASLTESNGIIDDADSDTRIYFQKLFPYPDRLVEWVITYRVKTQSLRAPFHNIRIGILASVVAALLLSLTLAKFGARHIGNPILRLTRGLTAYAGGDRCHRVVPSGSAEIQAASHAFNDMADSMDAVERERDEACAARYRSRRLASLGQMAAGIAHEISNPINTILSLTTLIERALPEDAVVPLADVRSIREESERAAETIRAIMKFSREIGGERTRFDAESWVRDTVALTRREHRAYDADVEMELNLDLAGSLTLEGDRRLLQRALRNLIENAAQASPNRARVQVRLGQADGDAVIEVLDQGPGLNEEQRDRAFDPFYTTKPEGQGSGLGLSISLGIVEYYGGRLELANRPGGGAMARMLLPVSSAPTARPDTGNTPPLDHS